jgi:hypothetical protein
MAAAKLAPGDMPARRPVPAGSLSPQEVAAATDGLVYDDNERAIALAIEEHRVPTGRSEPAFRPAARDGPAWDATNS